MKINNKEIDENDAFVTFFAGGTFISFIMFFFNAIIGDITLVTVFIIARFWIVITEIETQSEYEKRTFEANMTKL
jgi:hypothetical protein